MPIHGHICNEMANLLQMWQGHARGTSLCQIATAKRPCESPFSWPKRVNAAKRPCKMQISWPKRVKAAKRPCETPISWPKRVKAANRPYKTPISWPFGIRRALRMSRRRKNGFPIGVVTRKCRFQPQFLSRRRRIAFPIGVVTEAHAVFRQIRSIAGLFFWYRKIFYYLCVYFFSKRFYE